MSIVRGVVLSVALCAGCAPTPPPPESPLVRPPHGAAIGELLEGSTPQLFAPGLLSTGLGEFGRPSFAPDGEEVFFFVADGPQSVILRAWREDDAWRGPEVAPFSGRYPDEWPIHAPGGEKLYFRSRRPLRGEGALSPGFHTFVTKRTSEGWSTPRHVPALDRCALSAFGPDGSAWCHGRLDAEARAGRIYVMDWDGEHFSPPRPAPGALDGPGQEAWPSISADGSRMLLELDGFPALSRRTEHGEWSAPEPLRERYEFAVRDLFHGFLPDGQVVFCGWRFHKRDDREHQLSWPEILDYQSGPQNLRRDFYVMSAAPLLAPLPAEDTP